MENNWKHCAHELISSPETEEYVLSIETISVQFGMFFKSHIEKKFIIFHEIKNMLWVLQMSKWVLQIRFSAFIITLTKLLYLVSTAARIFKSHSTKINHMNKNFEFKRDVPEYWK